MTAQIVVGAGAALVILAPQIPEREGALTADPVGDVGLFDIFVPGILEPEDDYEPPMTREDPVDPTGD